VTKNPVTPSPGSGLTRKAASHPRRTRSDKESGILHDTHWKFKRGRFVVRHQSIAPVDSVMRQSIHAPPIL
jgi:hypothetical protein